MPTAVRRATEAAAPPGVKGRGALRYRPLRITSGGDAGAAGPGLRVGRRRGAEPASPPAGSRGLARSPGRGRPGVRRSRSAGGGTGRAPWRLHLVDDEVCYPPPRSPSASRDPLWTLSAAESRVRRLPPRAAPAAPAPSPVPAPATLSQLRGGGGGGAAAPTDASTLQPRLPPSALAAQQAARAPGGGGGAGSTYASPARAARPAPAPRRSGGAAGGAAPMRRAWNSNYDIEGSRPALTKFGRAVQRIVADPFPGANRAPVPSGAAERRRGWMQAGSNVFASGDEAWLPQRLGEGAGAAKKPSALYSSDGMMTTKEVEVWRGGRHGGEYVVTEVVTGLTPELVRTSAAAAGIDGGLRPGRAALNLRTDDICGAQTSTARQAAHLRAGAAATPRGMRSLDTADIPGARPRSLTPRRAPRAEPSPSPCAPAPHARPAVPSPAAAAAAATPAAGRRSGGRTSGPRAFYSSQIELV